jgi:GWxTD domain-containing protein
LSQRERHELQRVNSAGEAVTFLEEFWRRRDPDPDEPGNPFRDEFLRRVQDADLLYAESDLRGSLTDRGRTVILLGAPSNLQVSSRPALSWDPKSKNGHRTSTRPVTVETWGYRIEDLPPWTLEMLREKEKQSGNPLNLTLTFLIEQDRATLLEGEALLQQVKRAASYRPK